MKARLLKLKDGNFISWQWHDYARRMTLMITNDPDAWVSVELNPDERRKLIEALSYNLP